MTKTPIQTRQYSSFDDIEADFAEFIHNFPKHEVFLQLPWYRLLAEILRNDIQKLIVLVAWQSDLPECLTLLPLMQMRTDNNSQPIRLEGLANYYSVLYGPVTSAPKEQLIDHLSALFKELRQEQRFSTINLQPLSTTTESLSSLLDAARAARLITDTYFRFGNWYLPITWGKYDEYIRDRDNTLTGPLLRSEKRIMRPDMHCTVVVYHGDEADFCDAAAAFEQVYRNSWRQPEPYPDFVSMLCAVAARQGWLRLGILRLGTEPVAVQLWLTAFGKANIYKIAYDEKFSKFSPGNVLTARMIRYAIDIDRVSEIDYLTGDEPYKSKWMSNRRERVGLVIFNPRTVHGLACAIRHFGGKWIRNLQNLIRNKARVLNRGRIA